MAKVGRPKGTKKTPRVDYHRRILPEWVKVLDMKLDELKKGYSNYQKSIYK
jgi:hypothetical protein